MSANAVSNGFHGDLPGGAARVAATSASVKRALAAEPTETSSSSTSANPQMPRWSGRSARSTARKKRVRSLPTGSGPVVDGGRPIVVAVVAGDRLLEALDRAAVEMQAAAEVRVDVPAQEHPLVEPVDRDEVVPEAQLEVTRRVEPHPLVAQRRTRRDGGAGRGVEPRTSRARGSLRGSCSHSHSGSSKRGSP